MVSKLWLVDLLTYFVWLFYLNGNISSNSELSPSYVFTQIHMVSCQAIYVI